MQVAAIFYQEFGKDIHADVDVDFFPNVQDAKTIHKICRNLERLRLTPQLLHYELTNGFPSFSPFDPKEFGGYTYHEILNKIEISVLQQIAYFELDESYTSISCIFDFMSADVEKLFKETIQILAEDAQSSGKEFYFRRIMP